MRTLRNVLIVILICWLLLDALLFWVDPLGRVTFWQDDRTLMSYAVPSPEGWRFMPGTIRLRGYTAHIGINGFRAVPESNVADCSIVFVGDSVTFGMGADISFVNLLAPDIPAVVTNVGIPGYSAGNALSTIEYVPADGYVWLAYSNDDEEWHRWHYPHPGMMSATWIYLRYLDWSFEFPETRETWFTVPAQKILAREDTLTFAFAGQHLTDLLDERARSIPIYTSTVSFGDAHPSVSGHRQIAAAMHDAVLAFVRRICD